MTEKEKITLDKLKQVQKELETNTATSSKTELIKALINFQKDVGVVLKNAKNPFYKSNYADLNAYLEVIKEPLLKNGLLLIQEPIENGLRTTLYHSSGQYTTSEFKMQFPTDPQKVGSIITYFRRYAISSILMLNAEDDDGNKASKPENMIDENILINDILSLYKKVKNPNEKLQLWIKDINKHNISELKKGKERIKKILEEQK